MRNPNTNHLAAALGLVTHCIDVSLATPQMKFVFLIDKGSCCDRRHPEKASSLKHSLRLKLRAQAKERRGLLSGCQTFLLH